MSFHTTPMMPETGVTHIERSANNARPVSLRRTTTQAMERNASRNSPSCPTNIRMGPGRIKSNPPHIQAINGGCQSPRRTSRACESWVYESMLIPPG